MHIAGSTLANGAPEAAGQPPAANTKSWSPLLPSGSVSTRMNLHCCRLLWLICLLISLVKPALAHIPTSQVHLPGLRTSESASAATDDAADALTLHLDGLHDRAGPISRVLVRQNPWSKFDPDGLREKTAGGVIPTDRDHHKVPVELWDDYGFKKDAQQVFDRERIETPRGHNFTAHGREKGYTSQVEAELQRFLTSKGHEKGIGGLGAREQRELAEEFVREHIDNSPNQFIKGFNSVVEQGPEAVKQWKATIGSKLPLLPKHKAFKGLIGARPPSAVKRIMRGVPFIGPILFGVDAFASGGESAAENALRGTAPGMIYDYAVEPAGKAIMNGAQNTVDGNEKLRNSDIEVVRSTSNYFHQIREAAE